MRFLFVSTLYPGSTQPTRATYSRSLMLALRELGHEVRVIAPVFRMPVSGRGNLPPLAELLDGIPVLHPRIAYVPGLFTRWNHRLYRRAVRRCFAEMLAEFRPDHVSIGFAFPDGAAMLKLCEEAARTTALAQIDKVDQVDQAEGDHNKAQTPQEGAEKTASGAGRLGPQDSDQGRESWIVNRVSNTEQSSPSAFIPPPSSFIPPPSAFTYSLQVLGSDFRMRIQQPRFRKLVMDAIARAPLIFCPGQALKRDMIAAGIAAEKIVPFNNGVDHNLFHL